MLETEGREAAPGAMQRHEPTNRNDSERIVKIRGERCAVPCLERT